MSEPLWHELLTHVLLPLCEGKELRPLRPIGTKRAQEVAEQAAQATADMLEGLCELRARRARLLYPVDFLAPPSRAEWLLAAALNDLLIATHPGLTGWFGNQRPRAVLEMARASIELAGIPSSVGEALSRHATFGSSVRLRRLDTHVSYWAGSQKYIGEKPPARLFLWPDLRRVKSNERWAALYEFGADDTPEEPLYRAVLSAWLQASPLTQLAEMGQKDPEFAWSGPALGLVATGAGRKLVLRALDWDGTSAAALTHAKRATLRIPESAAQARRVAVEFTEELELQVARALNDFEAPDVRAFGARQSRAGELRRLRSVPKTETRSR
jgi:hypothetical protein